MLEKRSIVTQMIPFPMQNPSNHQNLDGVSKNAPDPKPDVKRCLSHSCGGKSPFA